jgi:hypothetical protein
MGRWVFSATFHFPQTMVNTWVDGYGCSGIHLQQTMVNTWVDGYGCPELHSNTKTPAVSIGTSVHSHIGTSFGC